MTYSQRNLTGLFEYSNGTMSRKKDGGVEYFGPPSRELDLIWEALLNLPLPTLLEDEMGLLAHVREKDRW